MKICFADLLRAKKINQMNKLSTVIICKNEEKNIRQCLESVKWSDEIIIYDSGSTDDTLNICKEYNCIIFINQEWTGFGNAKNDAVSKATNDWIFSIDADEVVTDELKQKLLEILNNKHNHYAFRVKRNSFFMGKMVRYSGWQRDYPLRFFNKNYARFNLKKVHESVETKEKIITINEILLHYTYPDIKTYINKMTHYSQLGSEQAFAKGKKSNILKALFSGIAKFVKMYIINFGFLDGNIGFVLAVNSAYGVYLKYIYLWEKHLVNKKAR